MLSKLGKWIERERFRSQSWKSQIEMRREGKPGRDEMKKEREKERGKKERERGKKPRKEEKRTFSTL